MTSFARTWASSEPPHPTPSDSAVRLPVSRYARWRPLLAILGAVILGAASFIGDVAPGMTGRIILAVFSTPAAWCMFALMTGYLYMHRFRSGVAAVCLLLLATTVYYVLVVASGTRTGGYSMTGGGALSQDSWLDETLSIARGLGFWAFASLAAGLFMGSLGYLIGSGSALQRSVSAGIAVGVSAGREIDSLVTIARYGVNEATSQLILPALAGLTIACLTAAALLMAPGPRPKWLIAVATSATSSLAIAALWGSAEQILNQL